MSDVVIKASLGFQVISNLRNVRVSKSHFETVSAGLTDNVFSRYGLKLPSDKEAFNRATGTDRAFGPDIKFDKVKSSDKYTMNLRRCQNDDTTWQKVGAVELTKVNSTDYVVETSDLSDEATLVFNQKWKVCKETLVTNDISKFFDRVCGASHAVSLRESGGVWFVPNSHRDEVMAAVNAVRDLTGSSASLLLVTVEDDGAGGEHRATVTAGVNNDIESALSEAQKAMDSYVNALEEYADDTTGTKRGPQNRTAVTSLKDIKALEAKISTYQDILELKTDAVQAKLNAFREFWKVVVGL